jgi:hypothetical protein
MTRTRVFAGVQHEQEGVSVRRFGIVGTVVGVMVLTITGAASAATVKMCIPKKEGSVVTTPKRGKCQKGYKLTSLGGEGKEGRPGVDGKQGPEGNTGPEGKAGTAGFTSGELETLKDILPHITYVGSGIAGKPTIQFTGINVQIDNGTGLTHVVNGEGNLVIGYDENNCLPCEHTETGSHNLILGTQNTFTSFGGIVSGSNNAITGQYSMALGGASNTASGLESAIFGGRFNTASGELSSMIGGALNIANGQDALVDGGEENKASGLAASVTGGEENAASQQFATVSGGKHNTASGGSSSVSGGEANTASGFGASVSGGRSNLTEGSWASVFGGKELKAKVEYEAIP